MDSETRLSGFGLTLLAVFLVIVIVFAEVAAVGGGVTAGFASFQSPSPKSTSSREDAGPAKNAPAANENAAPVASQVAGTLGPKARCAGCGVVETVRRVERRTMASGVCKVNDADRYWLAGGSHGGAPFASTVALPAMVRDATAPTADIGKTVVTSSYQIVVRFRDGTRRVFNEATARTLQSGERVRVIAGLD